MNAILEKLKQNLQDLFKKEAHYAWAMVLLVTCHVIYMTYFFPREWADTPRALAFIDAMASIIPAISELRLNYAKYTNYWGVFYAVYWLLTPIYFMLGFAGTFYLSAYRYEQLILKMPEWRFWLACCLSLALCLAQIVSPAIALEGAANPRSDSFIFLFLSWLTLAGCTYLPAHMFSALIIRRKIKLNY